MRFRFTAETRDGVERAGFLTADDRESAARQLERRGLTVHNLETASEASEASPTVRMPAPTLPPVQQLSRAPRPSRPDWRQHLAGLDGRRMGLGAALLLVVLSGLAWGVHRVFGGGRTYHLKLTGECKVVTRRAMPKDYWQHVRPRLWLPKTGWYISSRGMIFAKDKAGKWQTLEQRAKVDYQGSNEGNYTLTIDVALPAPPDGATLDFSARGYSRARKPVVFKPEGKLYTCQVPSMVLNPRWRRGSTRKRTGQSRPSGLRR